MQNLSKKNMQVWSTSTLNKHLKNTFFLPEYRDDFVYQCIKTWHKNVNNHWVTKWLDFLRNQWFDHCTNLNEKENILSTFYIFTIHINNNHDQSLYLIKWFWYKTSHFIESLHQSLNSFRHLPHSPCLSRFNIIHHFIYYWQNKRFQQINQALENFRNIWLINSLLSFVYVMVPKNDQDII